MEKLLLGLIGSGIQRSLTPKMHEEEARHHGLDAHYQLIDLDTTQSSVEALPTLLAAARTMGFAGLNITYPCKQAVIPLLDELSEEARAMGAVNTVVVRAGRLVGHNTDGSGWAWGFRRALPQARVDKVVQLGAGGAGSAVADALLRLGATQLVVVDREPARAEALARSLNAQHGGARVRAGSDVAAALADAQGLVHCTPTGMDKLPGLPLPAELLRPDLWVSEIVYFPLETALLKEARARGCATADGGGMAVGQAVGAFRLFTGRDPDPARMEAHFRRLVAERQAQENAARAAAQAGDGPMTHSPMAAALPDTREALGHAANPLGIEGLEFVEYETAKPQALGQVLETLGFRPVARHRSREVLLYRQGDMNVVVNAHEAVSDTPAIAAFALRVRDAGAAHRHAVARGAWPAPVEVQAMELHIPAIHGVGASRIYFVDRWREFSIWDVDFVPIPTVDARPPALAGLRWFGLVQYIGAGRTEDWSAFYRELFGWAALPDDRRFGILPRGRVLEGRGLRLQLIEPEPGGPAATGDEALQRAAFGVPDVLAAVQALRARGVQFVETEALHPDSRGAVTQPALGGVMFELVHDPREAP